MGINLCPSCDTSGPHFCPGPKQEENADQQYNDAQYVVRYYDSFDGWMRVFGPSTKQRCEKYYNEKTSNGLRSCETHKSPMGEYYHIFPANTKMMITPESLGR